jgi:malonyl-CoA O-methyltransferase
MSLSDEIQISVLSPADYAACAVLANTVGDEMLQRLEWVKIEPRVVLDVGCGTGNFTQKLQRRYPAASVMGIDIAYPMLKFAREQDVENLFSCADAGELPVRDSSVDLIFANLILPWCGDVKKLFLEWRRVLRPDGLLVFTALGPDTLKDFRSILNGKIIPSCVDMHELGDALAAGKFAEPVMDVDYFTLSYKSLRKFLVEMEVSGMLMAVDESMFSGVSRFDAVFEVVYGHAWRPSAVADHVADGDGEVRIPLAHLRGRRVVSKV